MEDIKNLLVVDKIKGFISLDETSKLFINLIAYIVAIVGIVYFVLYGYLIDNINLIKDELALAELNRIQVIGDGRNYKGIDFQIDFLNNFSKENEKIVSDKRKELVNKINAALPEDLSKSYVAKFFEELFLSLSQEGDPIILNSVSIGDGVENQIDLNGKKLTYKKYQVSVSFNSSEKKFKDMLDIIQTSGFMNEKYYYKGNPLPVMTTSSVNLNFEKEEKADKGIGPRSLQFFMYSYNSNNKTQNVRK